MQRMGMVIKVRPDRLDEYKDLHKAVWPELLILLRHYNIRNYSIYLREPENLLFGYWEYVGSDFAADSAALGAEPITRAWLKLCNPCQLPFDSRKPNEWWARMGELFHLD